MTKVFCPYCHRLTELVGGKLIYPRRPDLFDKQFYNCAPCKAYVGCHAGTTVPLGVPATSALRRLRHETHVAFDKLWVSKCFTRSTAYTWLAAMLHRHPQDCHIGQFDEITCQLAIKLSNEYLKGVLRLPRDT